VPFGGDGGFSFAAARRSAQFAQEHTHRPQSLCSERHMLKLILVSVFAVSLSNAALSASCSIAVDYAQTIEEMIKRGGYSYADDFISGEHFQIAGSGKHVLSCELVKLDLAGSREEVLVRMKSLGLRPARIEEFLAYAASTLDENDIVELGSVATDARDPFVAFVLRVGDGRRLDRGWFGRGWDGRALYLGIRE
jgi:hypothetical protein